MTPHLYLVSGAPRPWRVLLGLAFKGIDVKRHVLNYSEGDLRSDAFLAMNPRGTVPMLRAGRTTLRDSIAILAWLDRAYPERPLFGETADEAAHIWQVVTECADYLRKANRVLLTQAFASDGRLPAPESSEQAALQAGADLMHAECRYLEDILSDDGLFLAGERPSAAEAVAFPEIRLLQRAVTTRNDLMASVGFGYPPDLYPRTAAWKDRLNAMPEVAATMPEHWNESKETT